MTTKPSPIPPGPRVIPHLVVRDGAAALEFYAKAFGAEEILRLHEPDGRVAHAELSLFGGSISVASEYPSLGFLAPTSDRISHTLTVYVEDVDAVAARAVAAGAKLERPIEVEFYGDRSARLTDPFGHRWNVQSRVEDVSAAEMQRRLDAMCASSS
ncbi:Glyoxalase/Bleomycin resistance protein/Dioxygenase superfamily protein [Nannocystis exedens]|uniref:Glyoxalase/Bleomycin resistance protein/Dioxygenase superfamily protein n=1 Tax=Nannocystis exedens TaxID=54 RepID=A0A1I2BDP3_9BACT|nr:VOC family protein [Nannocystis exedens]PCC68032.1 glycosylase [Nannocystis exedens]SFE54284.1 Glyoxalase/Bleomycin resistance protein/Dioxygenase superfamily protein [Nannocystis exedens]